MFFKLAQNFFGESLGTPLTEKHITDHIPAYPTPYIRSRFFSCFSKNPFLVKIPILQANLAISNFYTRELWVFRSIFDVWGLNRLKIFSETIWGLLVRENTYPTIYPHIRHQKSKIDFWHFFKKWHFLVKKRHFFSRILGAKTKHNYDFFYIFDSKTTFLSAWIHILRVRTKQKTLFSTFFDRKKDIFEWSSQHFRRRNAKKHDFLHFWLKDDIFEWLNLHFRCKNHAKNTILYIFQRTTTFLSD